MTLNRRAFAILVGTTTAAQAQLDMRAHLLTTPTDPRYQLAGERTVARLDEIGVDFAAPRLILVNIAGTELIAYEAGREMLRSRVIVGTPRNRTPQMTSFVTSVRTNPPWHVPPSIAPEIRAGGAAGYRVVGGRYILPPGPNNPLGPLRIGLLDSDGIFLHGTDKPRYFARDTRTLSHGCVRVERVHELAAWLLDVPLEEVHSAIATGRTMEIHPMQEVQVVLAYLTLWKDEQGRLVHHPDPYGYDAPGGRNAGLRRVSRPLGQMADEREAMARFNARGDDRI